MDKLVALLVFASLFSMVVSQCNINCSPEWDPVCAYSVKMGYRTFSSACTLTWNTACYSGDFNYMFKGVCPGQFQG